MARMFISYSRADRQFVDEFVPLLRKVYGHDSVWFDDDIPGGHQWWELILHEIHQCELFIYLMSNEALDSPYCQAEFREALRLQKPFLPVIVRPKTQIPDDLPEDLLTALQKTQHIDLGRGFKDYQASAALYAAINRLMQSPSESPAPLAPHPVSEPTIPDKEPRRRLTTRGAMILVGMIGLIAVVAVILTSIAAPQAASPNDPVTRNAQWTPRMQTFNGVEMMLVPVGCFMMGSGEGEADERPIEQVCIDKPFWIDRFEVTNRQFGSVNNGCASYSSRPDQARDCVTWFEARDYCAQRESRLPTEAEWEYAARGPDGLIFPWGNEFVAENVAHGISSNSVVAEVGENLRASGVSWVGAYDMSGNVWEWMSTIYDQAEFPYPYDPDDGRENLTRTGVSRVLRGGGFLNGENNLRAADRGDFVDYGGDADYGFRCARTADALS